MVQYRERGSHTMKLVSWVAVLLLKGKDRGSKRAVSNELS
jgi:hypothetical protein